LSLPWNQCDWCGRIRFGVSAYGCRLAHGIVIVLTRTRNPEIQQFYTNPVIVNDFKTYIKKLITHTNPYTGLTYAEDPTIYAFETGNELSGPIFRDMNVPNAWTTEIAVST
jgi:mannan endo-1,4-beta-mannosidase